MQFSKSWFELLFQFLKGGKAISQNYVTTGDSAEHKICADLDYIIPALSIVNNGSSSIKFGADGKSVHLLLPSASYTWRYKNPVKSRLTYNDTGNSGVTIDIIS